MSMEFEIDQGEYVEVGGYVVHLRPRILSQVGHLDQYNDPSSGIATEFKRRMSDALADDVIAPDFSAAYTLAGLHSEVNEAAPDVVRSRVAIERSMEFYGEEKKPITKLLEDVSPGDIEHLVPDEQFLEDLHRQIDDGEYERGLNTLEEMHDAWPAEVFKYCGMIEELSNLDLDYKDDMILEIIEEMSSIPNEITLSADDTNALLLLTHFPARSRKLTRRLLIGLHIATKIDEQLGSYKTQHEDAMLENMKKAFVLENLHGQQLQMLNLSDDARARLIAYSAEYTKILAELQESGDAEEGSNFKELYWNIATGLDDHIGDKFADYPLSHLQTSDIGHVVGDITFGDMLQAFRQGIYHTENGFAIGDIKAEKCGLSAVILEDDPAQRRLTQEMISTFSPLTVNEGLVFETPEGIANDIIDRNDVGWFVLDIQNGDDLTAGVRVAESVLRRRLEIGHSRTYITVHSTSNEAVEEAAEYLQRIVDEGIDCEYSFPHAGKSSSRRASLSIEVRRKEWGLRETTRSVGRFFRES